MTTENDFHAAIDECFDDFHARAVLADFLQERDDIRAEGYRALALNQLRPDGWGLDSRCWRAKKNHHLPGALYLCCTLPEDWYALLDPKATYEANSATCKGPNRRDCEDAAALAFSKLPPARRAELLAAAVA